MTICKSQLRNLAYVLARLIYAINLLARTVVLIMLQMLSKASKGLLWTVTKKNPKIDDRFIRVL